MNQGPSRDSDPPSSPEPDDEPEASTSTAKPRPRGKKREAPKEVDQALRTVVDLTGSNQSMIGRVEQALKGGTLDRRKAFGTWVVSELHDIDEHSWVQFSREVCQKVFDYRQSALVKVCVRP